MKLTSQILSATSFMPTFLAGEHGTQIDFLAAEADAATLDNGDGFIVERVLEVGKPAIGRG